MRGQPRLNIGGKPGVVPVLMDGAQKDIHVSLIAHAARMMQAERRAKPGFRGRNSAQTALSSQDVPGVGDRRAQIPLSKHLVGAKPAVARIARSAYALLS